MSQFANVAQFDQSDVEGALIDFVPARVYVTSGTATEKRVAIASTASRSASMFLISQGGKVGKAAAGNVAMEGLNGIARAARNGNYKPLAETLACLMAETVFITSRASYEGLKDSFDARLSDIEAGKNGGLTSTGKMSPKLRAVTQALMLINAVYDGVDAIVAQGQ